MRPFIYEVPTWSDPPRYPHGVTVAFVLADLVAKLGSVPVALDTERAVSAFAGACALPITEPEIEADIIFPSGRWASRAWVRAAYLDFYKWCGEHGWLEGAPGPLPAKRGPGRPKKEPVAA